MFKNNTIIHNRLDSEAVVVHSTCLHSSAMLRLAFSIFWHKNRLSARTCQGKDLRHAIGQTAFRSVISLCQSVLIEAVPVRGLLLCSAFVRPNNAGANMKIHNNNTELFSVCFVTPSWQVYSRRSDHSTGIRNDNEPRAQGNPEDCQRKQTREKYRSRHLAFLYRRCFVKYT